LAWALEQEGVRVVRATTFSWHIPSLRVIEKVGMIRAGVREHETMGELLVFERARLSG
jgi:RimJ/RimL family protein N-acetyltransferase